MKSTKIVRTPTRAEGGVTEAELAQMREHTKMWIARAMRTDAIEPGKIVPAIKALYAAANLPEPRVIIAPSPLVMAFAYGASAAIWHHRKGGNGAATDAATLDATRAATYAATYAATDAATLDATYAATYAATRAATYAATDDATRAATYAATDDATRAATYAATDAATDAATRAATYDATRDATLDAEQGAAKACYALAGKLGLECAKRWYANYQGGNMWAWWDCYLTAARDILGLRLPAHEKYAAWEACAIHGGFRVLHEKFCIVSDFPEILKVDDQNQPHCENGPSHRWRDGWSLYHWHGVRVPAEWIEDKASLTPAMALKEENIEKRRAACEIVTWVRILQELNAETIDKDDDPQIGELLEVSLPGSGKEKFLRVLCGTKRIFCIPVPPTMKTALAANAWSYGLEPEEYQPEVRS